MSILLGLIVMVLLPAALSWGICNGMRALSPTSSRRRRLWIAAGIAGLIPVLVPLATMIARGLPYGMVPVIALLVLGATISLVIGLPVAIRSTRGDFTA